jgi:diguanylate cyclase (GGDEF)-like protein
VERSSRADARAAFPKARVPAQSDELGRAPYAVLAVIQGLSALFAALYAVVTPPGVLRTADVVAAVVLGAMAFFTWFAAPRMRDGWGLGFSLWVIEMLTLLGMLAVHTAEAQMTVGLGLVMLGVFAGWFRPRPRLFVHLGFLTAGLAATAALNPHLTSAVTYAVLISVLVGVTLMVSSLAQRQRELAMRDALTGAFNRRGLDVLAPPLLATAARSHAPVTVGLLDLDNFKGFNDLHGHMAGDVMLVTVAAAWMSEVRDTDLVARFGGDEFALVLPGSTPAQAEAAVARVRARSTAGFSIGFATWIPGEDVYDALRRADEALFDAKRRLPTASAD